jgi:purine-binding chemotaxis protein CheW
MLANSQRALAQPSTRSALLCRVASLICGLPLEHVRETMRPLPLEPFGGMPAFVDGLSIIRGVPVPVVDLARLLGNESNARRARLVVVKVAQRHVALSVEQVIGVRALEVAAGAVLPPLLASARTDFVSVVGALDARLLLVLESALILPSAIWQSLEAQAGEA